MASFSDNMQRLFGFAFQRKPEPQPVSFQPKDSDDGSIEVAASGAMGQIIDLSGTVRNDSELITKYREMAQHHEVDTAVDEVVSEIVAGEESDTVKIILDDMEQPAGVKKAIEDSFQDILEFLDFRHHGYDVVRRWYIDGRLFFHVIIDDINVADGIKEIRYIDPRKIRKVREVLRKRPNGASLSPGVPEAVTQVKNEYYLYTDKGFMNTGASAVSGSTSGSTSGLRISKDSIVYTTSGLTDPLGTRVLSYLHKAIKPLNMLRALEDAAVIYRLARSTERRVWHIDIGNLPALKAEQYVRDIMTKHKNRLDYDASDGSIKDNRKFINMLEDYWLPTRGGGQGTKVDVLPPGTAFNQIADIEFFQKKLYASLQIPVSRLEPENQYNDATATGITRDEIKFGKMISRLRVRFSQLFIKLLEKQLVLKQVMTIEDFQKISAYIRFDFVKDNHFTEAVEQQVLQARLNSLNLVAPFVGQFYSHTWIRHNILKQSDEEIEEMDKEIEEDQANPQYQIPPGAPPGGDEQGGDGDQGSSSVMVDPSQMNQVPQDQGPMNGPKEKKDSKKPVKKKNDFKSVASLLSKNS